MPVNEIVGQSFDVVTCFDVLEHVAEDAAFVANLVRIARHWIVITTPNFEISHAENPFHCREYTGPEMLNLLHPYRVHSLWGGNSHGTDRSLLTDSQFRQHRWPSHAVIVAGAAAQMARKTNQEPRIKDHAVQPVRQCDVSDLQDDL